MKGVKDGLFLAVFHISVAPPSTFRFYFLLIVIFSAVIPIKTIVSIGNKVKVKVLKFNSLKYVRLHLMSRVKKR